MNKKLILIFVLFLLSFGNVIGVSFPSKLNMLPGETKEFFFQIQSYGLGYPMNCSIDDLNDITPLQVTFRTNNIIIEAENRENVFGNVYVPKNLSEGNYKEEFCVYCRLIGCTGACLHPSYCGVPIEVNVVEKNLEKSVNFGKKEKPSEESNFVTYLVFIVFIALVGLFAFRVYKNHKKKEEVILKIKNKIEEGLRNGYGRKEIEDKFREYGFDDKLIAEAFRRSRW